MFKLTFELSQFYTGREHIYLTLNKKISRCTSTSKIYWKTC